MASSSICRAADISTFAIWPDGGSNIIGGARRATAGAPQRTARSTPIAMNGKGTATLSKCGGTKSTARMESGAGSTISGTADLDR